MNKTEKESLDEKTIGHLKDDISIKYDMLEKFRKISEEFLLWFNKNSYKAVPEEKYLIELGDFVTRLRDVEEGEKKELPDIPIQCKPMWGKAVLDIMSLAGDIIPIIQELGCTSVNLHNDELELEIKGK